MSGSEAADNLRPPPPVSAQVPSRRPVSRGGSGDALSTAEGGLDRVEDALFLWRFLTAAGKAPGGVGHGIGSAQQRLPKLSLRVGAIEGCLRPKRHPHFENSYTRCSLSRVNGLRSDRRISYLLFAPVPAATE